MALEMLSAYYSKGCDSREMFDGLKASRKNGDDPQAEEHAEAFRKNRNAYDVLYVDMQGIFDDVLQDPAFEAKWIEYAQKKQTMDSESFGKLRHPMLAFMQKYLIADIRKEKEYADFVPEDTEVLGTAIQNIYSRTGNKFYC